MRAARCPICKKALEVRTKNFPFCSARCKLIDAGNWLEGSYCVADRDDGAWGENR
ncbi:MAG: DNA gyrase inhibitor YacG [Polyangiales bacterium]